MYVVHTELSLNQGLMVLIWTALHDAELSVFSDESFVEMWFEFSQMIKPSL